MKTFPAEFRNVDLDIKYNFDLGVLMEAWNRRVRQMHADRLGRRYWLRLTLPDDPQSSAQAIRPRARQLREGHDDAAPADAGEGRSDRIRAYQARQPDAARR